VDALELCSNRPLICPSCQSAAVDFEPKSPARSAHPVPHEGRIAIVTDVGAGCGGRERRQETNDVARGRRSRVVLTPRRWCQVPRKQASCKFLGGDGGNKARSPGRARRKPLKPLRREGRVFRWTCGDYSCAFYLCTRGCGCNGHPAFPAPSDFRGEGFAQLGRVALRECGRVFACPGCCASP
jgi:hypothetical protein